MLDSVPIQIFRRAFTSYMLWQLRPKKIDKAGIGPAYLAVDISSVACSFLSVLLITTSYTWIAVPSSAICSASSGVISYFFRSAASLLSAFCPSENTKTSSTHAPYSTTCTIIFSPSNRSAVLTPPIVLAFRPKWENNRGLLPYQYFRNL